MGDGPSRRSFVRGSIAVAAAGVLNPLGMFFGSSARAQVPTGEYLRPLSDQEFWFSQLMTDRFPDAANGKAFQSTKGQFSLRLGQSGGFSLAYFSTLGFLGQYKKQKPEDYADLLIGSAHIPTSANRCSLILKMLASHRATANLTEDAPQPVRPPGPNVLATQPIRDLLPLERVSAGTLKPHLRSSYNLFATEAPRNPERFARLDKIDEIPRIPEAAKLAQKRAYDEFTSFNPKLEQRFEALDTSPLFSFNAAGERRVVEQLDLTLLATSFQNGLAFGRLAAIAYVALLEAGSQLKNDSQKVDAGDGKLVAARLQTVQNVEALLRCFGSDDFLFHGLNGGTFRPAVRVKNIAVLRSKGGDRKQIDFQTPFLPFEVRREAVRDNAQRIAGRQDILTDAVVDQFQRPRLSTWREPATTVSLVEAAFPACAQIRRHTTRFVQELATLDKGLSDWAVDEVILVPEVTSPMTYGGVAAALCQTLLIELNKGKLKKPQERFEFRQRMQSTVEDLLIRSSLGSDGVPLNSAGVSINNAAMIQYASGFRAAYYFADYVSDEAAKAEGAWIVYQRLREALPEFFTQELKSDQFLSAEQIGLYVGKVANAIRIEIESLRIRNRQLELELEAYKKFVIDLTKLIDQIARDGQNIGDRAALERFRTSTSQLITQHMQQAVDGLQSAALVSVQGLVNTFVQVGVNIDANVRAQVQSNIGICGLGGVNVNK